MSAPLDPVPELSLVLPCFRARHFLERNLDRVGQAFSSLPGGFECVAVEDGGGDGSAAHLLLMAESRPWLRPVLHAENQGKGRSVLSGLRHARGRFLVMNDIDLQYDIEDMQRCYGELRDSGKDLAIGSRLHPESLYHIHSHQLRYIFTRHLFSRMLNRFLRLVLLQGVADTQCGLKGFSRPFVDTVVSHPLSVGGFAFDIELLVFAREQGFSWVEVPVHFHYTDIPSSVKFLQAGALVFRDIIRIAWNRARGVYRRPLPAGSPS